MSDKIVMITDETDVCYGMLGKVIAEGDGLHTYYQLLITGYENCVKAGYSDKDIKDHYLDVRGFIYLIGKTNCRVMTDKEIEAIVKLSPDTSAKRKEHWKKAQQVERAEFLKLVDEAEEMRWLKDDLASSAFAKYEPTKNEEDYER